MKVAVDWDDTLVAVKSQEWLPGAREGLTRLLRDGHRVVVHTCRANWPEGLAQVTGKLDAAGLLSVMVWSQQGKPHADVYVDNQSFPPFMGDWAGLARFANQQPPNHRRPSARNYGRLTRLR